MNNKRNTFMIIVSRYVADGRIFLFERQGYISSVPSPPGPRVTDQQFYHRLSHRGTKHTDQADQGETVSQTTTDLET